eukprot:TRINITY_DN329_c0_g2_i2.p3 TRINITY_DN329_c0_g2~~TRINITY_DN329_c0_g2_i2.p3  ORF type:complete len:120 (+),score=54.28 TRINITY_DN329_c0_g2_i2:57-362(+)
MLALRVAARQVCGAGAGVGAVQVRSKKNSAEKVKHSQEVTDVAKAKAFAAKEAKAERRRLHAVKVAVMKQRKAAAKAKLVARAAVIQQRKAKAAAVHKVKT